MLSGLATGKPSISIRSIRARGSTSLEARLSSRPRIPAAVTISAHANPVLPPAGVDADTGPDSDTRRTGPDAGPYTDPGRAGRRRWASNTSFGHACGLAVDDRLGISCRQGDREDRRDNGTSNESAHVTSPTGLTFQSPL